MKLRFLAKVYIFIFSLAGLFLLSNALPADLALANDYLCESEGWAWSDTVGWISFDCQTDPADIDCENPFWQSYGVKVDLEGNFLGYAWSDWTGWIDFSPQDTSPEGLVNPAKLNFETGQVTGWARIIGSAGLPGRGWVSLSCQTDPNGCSVVSYGVEYDGCEFKGWAWSDDIGWICFNCQTDPAVSCTNYPTYKIKCGQGADPFELTEVSLNKGNPCSIIDLKWEKNGEVVYYNIKRNGSLLSQELYPVDDLINCPEEKNCIICADDICEYHDGAPGYKREPGMEAPQPETNYSYQIIAQGACGDFTSNSKSVTTTICPPELSVTNLEQYCQQLRVDLSWGIAATREGGEGAENYFLYQSIGGQPGGYQKVLKECVYNPITDMFDCTYEQDTYSWSSPDDDPATVWENPFVFKKGVNYSYFIRAVDGPDNGISQNVDSNVVNVCCFP